MRSLSATSSMFWCLCFNFSFLSFQVNAYLYSTFFAGGALRSKFGITSDRYPQDAGPMIALTSWEHLGSMLEEAPQDQLCVIQYHAVYCKSCKQIMIHFKKRYRKESKLQFASLECSKLPNRHSKLTKLGIPKFPYVQVWRNGALVASFGSAEEYTKKLSDILRTCKKRSNKEWDNFLKENSAEVSASINLLEEVTQSQGEEKS